MKLRKIKEPDVIIRLRKIIKNGRASKITHPENSRPVVVNLQEASNVVKLYEKLPSDKQRKYVDQSIVVMIKVAMKLLS